MTSYVLKIAAAIIITTICILTGLPAICGAVGSYFIINAIDKRIEVK